jgi:predicted ABC-type sugar transport system permease subunit
MLRWVLVTVLGWLALLSGLARMFLPMRLASIAAQIGQSRTLIAGSAVVLLLVGGFLSFKAYSRD